MTFKCKLSISFEMFVNYEYFVTIFILYFFDKYLDQIELKIFANYADSIAYYNLQKYEYPMFQ